MDEHRARDLIGAERARVETLLAEAEVAAGADRSAEDEPEHTEDRAEPLTTEGTDDAVTAALRRRLDELERAERRLEAGTFGVSVRSGRAISDERLEADPAAELTIDEAQQS